MTYCTKSELKLHIFCPFAGEHEVDPEDHPEGDVCQLDPAQASDHRHVHDDGPTTLRHQLRKLKLFLLSQTTLYDFPTNRTIKLFERSPSHTLLLYLF